MRLDPRPEVAPSAAPVAFAQVGHRRRRGSGAQPYLWLLPAMLVFGIFTLLPLAVGLFLSFFAWDGSGDPRFIGLGNYLDALVDPKYGPALIHNVIYAVGTVVGKVVLGLGLALLLNTGLRARVVFRTLLFIPVVMSFVVIGILWTWIYSYSNGLLNAILDAVGLSLLKKDWLGDPGTALYAVMAVDLWKWFGFHMVLFLAGLQSIPAELYEAARIDGANRPQCFRYITLPMLAPITLVNVVLASSGAFNVFDVVYVMTQGGPANASEVAMTYVYRVGFQFYQFGYASALSMIQLALVAAITLILFLGVGRGQRE
jgi:raffinose/stachyose/melibiose transport system permease protein